MRTPPVVDRCYRERSGSAEPRGSIIPAHMEDIYCFGGNPLDRASERRDDTEWIVQLLGDPGTRLLALRDLKPFTRSTAVPALDWQPVAAWREQIDGGRAADLSRPRRRARAFRDRCGRREASRPTSTRS